MDSAQELYYNCSDGTKMPKVGLGVYLVESTDLIYEAIVTEGYRHIDTASFYKNEELIGEALQRVFENSDVKREDLYVVTKIWGDQRNDVEGAIRESLSKLKLDYVDLYLMHWPLAYKTDENGNKSFDKIPIHKTWKEMEQLVEKGLTRSIGVSNFNVQSIIDLLTYANILPVCNQIELHPYLIQEGLVDFLHKVNIIPVAYCPLTNPGYDEFGPPKSIFEQEVILELSEKYGKTPAQIVLNWGIARGHCVIPKTSKISRLSENFASQSFTMDKTDVEKVTALDINWRALSSKKLPWTLTWDLFA